MATEQGAAGQLLLRGKYLLTDARLKTQGLIPDGGMLIDGGSHCRHGILCRPRQAAPTGAGGRRREPSPPAGPGGRPLPRARPLPHPEGSPHRFPRERPVRLGGDAAPAAGAHGGAVRAAAHSERLHVAAPQRLRRRRTGRRAAGRDGDPHLPVHGHPSGVLAGDPGREPTGPGRGGISRHTAARPAGLGGAPWCGTTSGRSWRSTSPSSTTSTRATTGRIRGCCLRHRGPTAPRTISCAACAPAPTRSAACPSTCISCRRRSRRPTACDGEASPPWSGWTGWAWWTGKWSMAMPSTSPHGTSR